MFAPFPGPYGISYGSNYAFSRYGTLQLTDASPAQIFAEPLSLLEVKDYLKLPIRTPSDVAEDDTITSLITAARETAEILQGRDLVRKQWDLAFDYWTDYRIELRPELVSVDRVQYRDSNGAYTTLTENTDYIVDKAKRPGVILPPFNHTWPMFTAWPSSAILVRFTCGLASTAPFWSDAGGRVKVGMKRLILEWFVNRIPTGVKVEELPFGITAALSYGAVPRAR
jgi:uncharacterized phiE125 gp8 family phage protein